LGRPQWPPHSREISGGWGCRSVYSE
jgi:hypothetical protein